MMKKSITYKISDMVIAINFEHAVEQTERFRSFIVENIVSDYKIEVKCVDELPVVKGNEMVHQEEYTVYLQESEFIRYYHSYGDKQNYYAVTVWDWENRKATINYLPQGKNFFSQSGNMLFHIGLEMILLREKRLILHAACVNTKFGGVLFTGQSGAGKSTQADLWVKHRDAFLINGDRPILSKEENGWKAWGSPYAGSSRCYVNENCDASAIVRVIQDSENKVRRLKGSEAFSVVFSGTTVNDWSREDVSMASELVIDLINSVPVYELHCTKNEEAVLILENVLKGDILI